MVDFRNCAFYNTYLVSGNVYIGKGNKFMAISDYERSHSDKAIFLFPGVKGIYAPSDGENIKFTCFMLFSKHFVMFTEYGELIDINDVDPNKIQELHIPLKNYSLMNEDTKFYDKNKISKYKVVDIVILKDCDDGNDLYQITSINGDQIKLRSNSLRNISLFVSDPNYLIKIQNNDLVRFKGCDDSFRIDYFRVKDNTICIYGNYIPILSFDFKTFFQIKRSGEIIYECQSNPIVF